MVVTLLYAKGYQDAALAMAVLLVDRWMGKS